MPDDFTTQPSGNFGAKIACGEIKKLINFPHKQIFLYLLLILF